MSEWWLLQRFEAHVHLSQGQSSPQAKEMHLYDPDLGLLGGAKGRTWKGCERCFFQKILPGGFCKRAWKGKAGGLWEAAGCCNMSNITTDGKH